MMKLNYEKIREITRGTAYISEENGKIVFHRFTKEQEEAYSLRNADFYSKAFASSGVRMEFVTDSKELRFSGEVSRGSTRSYWAFDIFVDGELVKSIGGSLSPDGGAQAFALQLPLAEGAKTVKILLPWSVKTLLSEIALDDGAYINPIEKQKTMLMYGDSITQGYDAESPSLSYASRVSEALGVTAINKGIGGEFFWGELATLRDDISPDYITVAYGTNNWAKRGKAEFEENCKAFYENLSKSYPKAKIFAITPIWRADIETNKREYPFAHTEEYIREVCEALPNVTVISGFKFVPEDTELLRDKYLHPNGKGFKFYAESMLSELRKYIN